MTGSDKLCECMSDRLRQAGVDAVTAWSRDDKKRRDGPVVAVSLREFESRPGSFQDYLGERYNTDARRWEELYGKRAKLTFGLDIYAAGRDGAAECQSTFDSITDALQTTHSGLRVEQLSRGETAYDQELGLFRSTVEAVCSAYFYAVADESGVFVDFEVRGARNG